MANNNKNVSSIGLLNIIAIIVLIVIAGAVGFLADKYNPKSGGQKQEIASVQAISYDGEEGKTALDLLKAKAEVETQDSSIGVFVMAINGTANTDDHFWMFYVNSELAPVASDQYQTANGDKIEWRYEAIQ